MRTNERDKFPVQPECFSNILLKLTGETEVKRAAERLANKELDLLLRSRNWQEFELRPIPVLDIFSLHPEIYPLIFITEDERGSTGYVDKEGEVYKIKIQNRFFNDETTKNHTLVHELGHIILSKTCGIFPFIPALWRSNSLRMEIEEFCEEFACHFLLPERLLTKWFAKNDWKLSIEMIEEGSQLFSVSLETFVTRLRDKPDFLDKTQRGVLLSWDSSLRAHLVALPSWGFIPQHERIKQIGLESGIKVFYFGSEEVKKSRDCLRVQVNSQDRKFFWLETDAANKVYPLNGYQKLLLSVFNFPDPNSTQTQIINQTIIA